ncbi:MAG: branched-chain amino acid ABC transporter permease [Paracoccaceae bacterium]|nr:branched-chain amino acid ABC transporter permease [Paracoccaceae bacterium]
MSINNNQNTDIQANQNEETRARISTVKNLKRRFVRNDVLAMVLLFGLMLIAPLFPSVKGWMLSQASLVIIYIIAALGVMVLVGFTGLVSVGHGGFLAIGAYTSALLTLHLGVDLVVGIIAALLMSGLIGAGLALIFLRLSGAFMAIGTLGFAFFVGTILNNIPFFQGRDGILLDANFVLGFEIYDHGFYLVSVVCLILVTLFVYMLVNSGTGRAFMALRDAEKAAMASGVNRLKFRTLAFSISAAITGIAGALNAHVVNYVSAEVFADIWYSVDILMAVVVGGSVAILGPFVGGFFVVMMPFYFEQLADFSFIMKGVVLILVLRFAPAGVAELILRPLKNARRTILRNVGGSMVETKEPKDD